MYVHILGVKNLPSRECELGVVSGANCARLIAASDRDQARTLLRETPVRVSSGNMCVWNYTINVREWHQRADNTSLVVEVVDVHPLQCNLSHPFSFGSVSLPSPGARGRYESPLGAMPSAAILIYEVSDSDEIITPLPAYIPPVAPPPARSAPMVNGVLAVWSTLSDAHLECGKSKATMRAKAVQRLYVHEKDATIIVGVDVTSCQHNHHTGKDRPKESSPRRRPGAPSGTKKRVVVWHGSMRRVLADETEVDLAATPTHVAPIALPNQRELYLQFFPLSTFAGILAFHFLGYDGLPFNHLTLHHPSFGSLPAGNVSFSEPGDRAEFLVSDPLLCVHNPFARLSILDEGGALSTAYVNLIGALRGGGAVKWSVVIGARVVVLKCVFSEQGMTHGATVLVDDDIPRQPLGIQMLAAFSTGPSSATLLPHSSSALQLSFPHHGRLHFPLTKNILFLKPPKESPVTGVVRAGNVVTWRCVSGEVVALLAPWVGTLIPPTAILQISPRWDAVDSTKGIEFSMGSAKCTFFPNQPEPFYLPVCGGDVVEIKGDGMYGELRLSTLPKAILTGNVTAFVPIQTSRNVVDMRVDLFLHQQKFIPVADPAGAAYARLKGLAMMIEMYKGDHLGQCSSTDWRPLNKLSLVVNGEMAETVLSDTFGDNGAFEWKPGIHTASGDLLAVPFVGDIGTCLVYFSLQCDECKGRKRFVCTVDPSGDIKVRDAATKGPVALAGGWCLIDIARTPFIQDCDGLLELYPDIVSGLTLASSIRCVDGQNIMLSVAGEMGGVCARTFDASETRDPSEFHVLSVATTPLMHAHALAISCGYWTKSIPLVFLTVADTYFVYLSAHHVFAIKIRYRTNRACHQVSLATAGAVVGDKHDAAPSSGAPLVRAKTRNRGEIRTAVEKNVAKIAAAPLKSAPPRTRPKSAPPTKTRSTHKHKGTATHAAGASPRHRPASAAHPYLGRGRDIFGLMPRDPARKSTSTAWYQEMERKPAVIPDTKAPSFHGEWLLHAHDGRYVGVMNDTLVLQAIPSLITLEQTDNDGEYFMKIPGKPVRYAHLETKSRVMVVGAVAESFHIVQTDDKSNISRRCIRVRTAQDELAICEHHGNLMASASVSAVVFELERQEGSSLGAEENLQVALEDRVEVIQRWRKKVLGKEQQLSTAKVRYRKAYAELGVNQRRFNQLINTVVKPQNAASTASSSTSFCATTAQCVECGGEVKGSRRYCLHCAKQMDVDAASSECVQLYHDKLALLGRCHRSDQDKHAAIVATEQLCHRQETREEQISAATDRLQYVIRVRTMQLGFEAQKKQEEARLEASLAQREEQSRQYEEHGERLRLAEEQNGTLTQQLSDVRLEMQALIQKLAVP